MGRWAAGEGGGVEGRALQKMKNPDVERCRAKADVCWDSGRIATGNALAALIDLYSLTGGIYSAAANKKDERILEHARRTEADADVMAKALGVEL